ncbi:helix-turn-helix domain-containing protein [Neobacillus niacini]|uniref:helix-turn-helix domain-containing protein n=1 Tax=Neobacillus niacini TaxID=86668 RepID=UPI003B01F164
MYYGKFELGKIIRRLRIERQLTIEQVAEYCGVDTKYINQLEEGLHPDMDLFLFYRIASLFNMKPSALINEISKENEDHLRRMWEERSNHLFTIVEQRQRRKKQDLQKKITHNFKNKHNIQQLKSKNHF